MFDDLEIDIDLYRDAYKLCAKTKLYLFKSSI